MGSPFPGMDPYLERYWGDVHQRLVIYACDQLQYRLPSGLRARVEERVFVETPDATGRGMYPDVRVVERGRDQGTAGVAQTGLAVADPLVIHLGDEPVTQGYIEVIDVGSGKRVVTVIEVLSPSNKQPGPGQDLYLRKQSELLQASVSLVEIDLVRTGKRVLSIPPFRIPPSHRTIYQVVVRRGWQRDRGEVYRIPLQEPLPPIKVPLRESDADVPLDLQAILEDCYRKGRYDDDIDYQQDPEPPLEPEDARWADELLRGKARRS